VPDPAIFERFAVLVATSGHPALRPSALAELGLLVAAGVGQPIDVAEQLARFDPLAEQVGATDLDGLRRSLFGPGGFRGDGATYGAVDNSLLDRVLDRRMGIPITLSMVAIEVGRRVGIPLVGVGMPGHFLLRDAVDEDRFVDPFDRGASLDREGARALFGRHHGPAIRFDPSYLDPSPPATVIARVLANLANACRAADDHRRLEPVARFRTLLPGADARAFEQHGMALQRTGAFDRAADALHEAAEREPRQEEADQLRDRARSIRASLN